MPPPRTETSLGFSTEFLAQVEDVAGKYLMWAQAAVDAGRAKSFWEKSTENMTFWRGVRYLGMLAHLEYGRLHTRAALEATGACVSPCEEYGPKGFFDDDLGGGEFSVSISPDSPLGGRFEGDRVVVRVLDADLLPETEEELTECLSGIGAGKSGVRLVATPGMVLEWDERKEERYERGCYILYLVDQGQVTKLNSGTPHLGGAEAYLQRVLPADV